MSLFGLDPAGVGGIDRLGSGGVVVRVVVLVVVLVLVGVAPDVVLDGGAGLTDVWVVVSGEVLLWLVEAGDSDVDEDDEVALERTPRMPPRRAIPQQHRRIRPAMPPTTHAHTGTP